MHQNLRFTSGPDPAAGIRVEFAPTRTSCTGLRVGGLPNGTQMMKIDLDAHGAEVRWLPPVPPGTRIDLAVEGSGESLAVAWVTWYGEAPPAIVSGVLAGFGASESVPALAFLHARWAAVAAHPQAWFREYGAFFYELDLNTNPNLLPFAGLPKPEATHRFKVITRMEGVLIRRLRARTRGEALIRSPEDDVRYISRILLEMYAKHLGNGNGATNPERAWDAFSRFANGELRVPAPDDFTWNGEPNSGAVFCFAEIGFMAHEMGVDAPAWETLLPSQVAMQPVFTAAYRPLVARPVDDVSDYRPEDWREANQVPPEGKAALWEQFRGMTVPELEEAGAAHLRNAFDWE